MEKRNEKYEIVYKDVWVTAWVSGTTECIELRTWNREKLDESVTIYHKEYGMGILLADLLDTSAEVMNDSLRFIDECVQYINYDVQVMDNIHKLYMHSELQLSSGAIMLPFAAEIFRLFIQKEEGQVLDTMRLHALAEQYQQLQNRFKRIAEECFCIKEGENAAMRYLLLQKNEPEVFDAISFGNLSMEKVVVGERKRYILRDLSVVELGAGERGEEICTEVLHTTELGELFHFFLSRFLLQNMRYQTCKFCGKYFGVVGKAKGDYCDRLMYGSTKTCKEGGSLRLYEKRQQEDPAVREYKRSYKAHNARIRYKTMTREEFNQWSVEARKRRDKCIAGEISLAEFVEWLDSDKR